MRSLPGDLASAETSWNVYANNFRPCDWVGKLVTGHRYLIVATGIPNHIDFGSNDSDETRARWPLCYVVGPGIMGWVAAAHLERADVDPSVIEHRKRARR